MLLTNDFFSNFTVSSASGIALATNTDTSRIVVATMKKNNNMNTMSGNEAVEIAGVSFLPSFLNFAITFSLLCF